MRTLYLVLSVACFLLFYFLVFFLYIIQFMLYTLFPFTDIIPES